jgi:hypothetical protein
MLTLLTALAIMAAGTGGPSYPACPDGWEVGSTDGWEVGGKCVDPAGVIWTYDGKTWTTDGVIWSADGVIW